jgi:hypothetical protein
MRGKKMKITTKSIIGASMLALTMGSMIPVKAADSYEFTLPAGLACEGFDLTINVTGSDHRVLREWTDEEGNVVRMITAGKGSDLVFLNEASGATLSLKANGAVEKTTYNPDGTISGALMGHMVLILFPTDVPAGPSTTLNVGRILYTIGTDGVWTLQEMTGKATDICAALSE